MRSIDEKRYRLWVINAISKARKSPTGKINYMQVSILLSPDTAFSWMQWAVAAGYLHTDGGCVYEGTRFRNWAITDILHELNKND